MQNSFPPVPSISSSTQDANAITSILLNEEDAKKCKLGVHELNNEDLERIIGTSTFDIDFFSICGNPIDLLNNDNALSLIGSSPMCTIYKR